MVNQSGNLHQHIIIIFDSELIKADLKENIEIYFFVIDSQLSDEMRLELEQRWCSEAVDGHASSPLWKNNEKIVLFSWQKLKFQALARPSDDDQTIQTSAFKYVTLGGQLTSLRTCVYYSALMQHRCNPLQNTYLQTLDLSSLSTGLCEFQDDFQKLPYVEKVEVVYNRCSVQDGDRASKCYLRKINKKKIYIYNNKQRNKKPKKKHKTKQKKNEFFTCKLMPVPICSIFLYPVTRLLQGPRG